MFSPVRIFSVLWITQIVVHILFADAFDPFSWTTWLLSCITPVMFAIGAFAARRFSLPRKSSTSDQLATFDIVTLFLVIYIPILVYVVYGMFTASGGFSGSVGQLRNAIIADKLAGGATYGLDIRILSVGVAFSLYLLCKAKAMGRKRLFFVFAIGLISAICTTGRLYLLLLFIGASAALYRQGVIKRKHLVIISTMFLLVFFAMALVIGKGGENGDLISRLLWNVKVYLFGSLSCFNHYVITDQPKIAGGAMLPNSIRLILMNFLPNLQLRPDLNPFIEVPFPSNTYTLLFPIYYDLGTFGVITIISMLGAFHMQLYMRFQRWGTPEYIYLYALSLYPLVMSIFEDAYFSSPGFWLTMWLPLIVDKLQCLVATGISHSSPQSHSKKFR